MKMKNIFITSALAAAVLASGSAYGASSKFAAHVADAGTGAHLLHSGLADTEVPAGGDCPAGSTLSSYDTCVYADDSDEILSASLHTANKSDLLIGVSLQSSLYTDTQVKGKNGSSEKAGAEAAIAVAIKLDGELVGVYPENVVFASRVQELSATLGGVIESCEVEVTEELVEVSEGVFEPTGTSSGEIVIADDCVVSDEEIGLILSTTSANHFNFVAPNLSSGDHTIEVFAKALSSAAFTNGSYTVGDLTQEECEADGGEWDAAAGNCVYTTTDNEARAWALVQVGTLTVEEVRATNDGEGLTFDIQ